MPNERATQLAKQLLDDLRGATYYADPKILGGFLKGGGREQERMARVRRSRFSVICFTDMHQRVQPIKRLRSLREYSKASALVKSRISG